MYNVPKRLPMRAISIKTKFTEMLKTYKTRININVINFISTLNILHTVIAL